MRVCDLSVAFLTSCHFSAVHFAGSRRGSLLVAHNQQPWSGHGTGKSSSPTASGMLQVERMGNSHLQIFDKFKWTIFKVGFRFHWHITSTLGSTKAVTMNSTMNTNIWIWILIDGWKFDEMNKCLNVVIHPVSIPTREIPLGEYLIFLCRCHPDHATGCGWLRML